MRVLSIAMLLILGAAVLTGCGGGESQDEKEIKEKAGRVEDNTQTRDGQTIKSEAVN